jgi:hypothetical protein
MAIADLRPINLKRGLQLLHPLAIADDLCVYDMALVLGMSVSALSHQHPLDDDHIRRLVLDAAAHAAEAGA